MVREGGSAGWSLGERQDERDGRPWPGRRSRTELTGAAGPLVTPHTDAGQVESHES
jgi:hypothetical protein